jgi:hypothetical protein
MISSMNSSRLKQFDAMHPFVTFPFIYVLLVYMFVKERKNNCLANFLLELFLLSCCIVCFH